MNRLERLYAITDEIKRRAPRATSAAFLANEFGVTRRTIERDLDSLRRAGVPIYADLGRVGGHQLLKVREKTDTTVVMLSVAEVTALLVAIAAAGDVPFNDGAMTARKKLLDGLPSVTRLGVEELRHRIRVADVPSSSGSKRIRRTIEQAVRDGLVVNISYRNAANQETSRSVEAVGFYRGNTHWFLLGWCRLRNDGRIFRLDRITTARLTKQSFELRNVETTLGWVPVELRTP